MIDFAPRSTSAYCIGDELRAVAQRLAIQLRQSEGLPAPAMVTMCNAQPELLAMLVKDGFAKRLLARCSPLANALAAFLDYDAVPECEEIAFTSDESLEIILRAATYRHIKPRFALREAAELLKDPYRLFRLGHYDLADARVNAAPDDPLARFLHWWIQDRPEPVAPPGLPEEYIYRAALRVKQMGGAPDLRGISSARWAYHCLRDAIPSPDDREAHQMLLDALHQSPGWTADYCQHFALDADLTAAHLKRCDPTNAESLLLGPWYGEFVRREINRPIAAS